MKATSLTETIENRKNKIVDELSTEYSLNRITIEEYERLIKYSQDIETEKELVIFEKIVKEHIAPVTQDSAPKNNKKELPAKIRQDCFTLLSSRKTTGPMSSGTFTTILGEHKLILTEDDLINDKTVLNVSVLLGEMIIQIPPNVSVINKTIPLLANVNSPDTGRNNPKKIVIKGSVLLGEIKFKIK